MPRQRVAWPGKCLLQEEPAAAWVECRVLDISVIGVGIEVTGAMPRDLIGRHVTIEVNPPVGTSVMLRMLGEVRNAHGTPGGGTRVGMQFVGLSEVERSILTVLELMQVAW